MDPHNPHTMRQPNDLRGLEHIDIFSAAKEKGYWSFTCNPTIVFASDGYPNFFHRWMHKILLGITWRKA